MGAISPSVFITRDFFEYVLPTVLLLFLFTPFSHGTPGLDLLVAVALVAGYFVTAIAGAALEVPAILSSLEALYARNLPNAPGKTRKEIDENYAWWGDLWDFDTLFYSLSKDDREYAYLTRAYSNLFFTASFYFLLYLVVNSVWFVGAVLIEMFWFGPSWDALAVRTPILGGWSAPTLLVLPFAYLAFQTAYSWFLTEHLSLYADWGTYCRFAMRYQREFGELALGIWGVVTESGKPVRDLRIGLVLEGNLVREVRADREGRFKFPGEYRNCLDRPCALRFSWAMRIQERAIEVAPKTIPEFIVMLDQGSWQTVGEGQPVRSRLARWLRKKVLGERRGRHSV